MLKKYLLILFVLNCLCSSFIIAQSIAIDGKFNDWNGISTYIDAAADGNGIDLKGLSVTNDENNLYIRLIVNGDFNLSDSNNIYLNIDADNIHRETLIIRISLCNSVTTQCPL